MLTALDKLPRFSLMATVSRESGHEFRRISSEQYLGNWLVLFFWPMDFTFVCPTEIAEFGRHSGEFAARGADVLGGSTDSQYVHLAWRDMLPSLRDLPFPMLADVKHELVNALGILHPDEGVALRATFIVDPVGTIRYASANDLKVGRSVKEVLRVIDALQTDALTPCDWHAGEPTLEPNRRR